MTDEHKIAAEVSELVILSLDEMLTPEQKMRFNELIISDPGARKYYLDYLSIQIAIKHIIDTSKHKEGFAFLQKTERPPHQEDGIVIGKELAEYEKNGKPVEVERNVEPAERVLSEREREAKIRAFLAEEKAMEEQERMLAELERRKILQREIRRRRRIALAHSISAKIKKYATITAMAAVGMVTAYFVYALLTPAPRTSSIATLTDGINLKWAEPDLPAQLNSLLRPGYMKLIEGYAEISFDSGAKAILQAPAEIELQNASRAYLQSGILSATVPLEARGFTLNTPSASIVDLGTEFSVHVTKDGSSDIHVIKGKVSLLAGKIDNLVGKLFETVEQIVEAGQARHVKTGICKIQKIPFNQATFARNIPLPYKPSPYELAVRRSNPTCYWRFSGNDSRKCINSADADRYGAEYFGSIEFESSGPDLGDGQPNNALKLGDGYVLAPDIKIDGPDMRGSSIALWLRPDIISSNKQSIIWQDTSGKLGGIGFERLLFMDEKGHLGFLIFTSLYDENNSNIVEVLSTKKLQAGRWSHVAVIITSDNVQLSINGRISKTRINLTSQILDPDLIWHTFVGTPRNNRGEGEYFVLGRSTYSIFKGDVDEVALFNRALQAEEISRLYMSAKQNILSTDASY